jgi:hypothetical protein
VWNRKTRCDKGKLRILDENRDTDTDSSEINKSVVCEIVGIDSSFTQFSYLSAALDIPCMSSAAYFSVENEVLNSVKEAATNEMIDAGQVDFRLAIQM